MVVQENSVYWKTGVDKLVLKDGELFYGEYLGNQDKKITFKIEFKDKANIFEVSNIRHLELANGKNIIRNNRDHADNTCTIYGSHTCSCSDWSNCNGCKWQT